MVFAKKKGRPKGSVKSGNSSYTLLIDQEKAEYHQLAIKNTKKLKNQKKKNFFEKKIIFFQKMLISDKNTHFLYF